jgi:predicted O-methyltransferase YrrM
VPGFLTEHEAKFLGMAAAMAPPAGVIVEIGSFKGKSTVMLAAVAAHYRAGSVVAIDPHTFSNPELAEHRATTGSSWHEFNENIQHAGAAHVVEAHRAFSTDMAANWSRPIRLLWIDGNHTFEGAKADFDGFMPNLVPGGIVAFHDALHPFTGPIQVFIEYVLRSDRFGAAGFVGSIAWAQYRPETGVEFADQREDVERAAQRLLPYLADDGELHGLRKLAYKLQRSRVPRAPITPEYFASLIAPHD